MKLGVDGAVKSSRRPLMRIVPVSLVVLGLALVSGRLVLAESEGDDDAAGWGGWTGAVVRPQHDVVCTLRVIAKKNAVISGTTAKATLVVANKARTAVHDVALAVYADSASSAPLWTQTIWLRGHRRAVRHLRLDVPADATSLVAVANCATDDNPGNNIDTVIVGTPPVGGGTTGGGTTGGTIGTHSPSAIAGAATYSSNCASCHGAAAQGTRLAPRILGRSASSVYEAVREGDDGMPRFLGITTTDAKNIAAFLADPAAATASPPPPAGPATYSGSVQAMFAASCVACHQGSSAPYGVRLDTYADASANAAAALAAMKGQALIPGTSSIDPTAMPPGSNPSSPTATTTANIDLLTAWIAAGKPQ
jgi:mono/diheme cytochrome c family protein